MTENEHPIFVIFSKKQSDIICGSLELVLDKVVKDKKIKKEINEILEKFDTAKLLEEFI